MCCFIYLNSKVIKKEVVPKWCCIYLRGKHLFLRKDITSTRAFLEKYSLTAPLEVQEMDVLEKSTRFLTLDLNTKLITFVYVGWLHIRC